MLHHQSNHSLRTELSFLQSIDVMDRTEQHINRINKIEDILGKREYFYKVRKMDQKNFSVAQRFHVKG